MSVIFKSPPGDCDSFQEILRASGELQEEQKLLVSILVSISSARYALTLEQDWKVSRCLRSTTWGREHMDFVQVRVKEYLYHHSRVIVLVDPRIVECNNATNQTNPKVVVADVDNAAHKYTLRISQVGELKIHLRLNVNL